MRAYTISSFQTFWALIFFLFAFASLTTRCASSKPAHLKTVQLRKILARDDLTIMPCCYDGLTAKLIENAGFEVTFMTGFGVSASYGLPDLGLVAGQDMYQAASTICSTLREIPCIGDGDTGYGNPMNIKQTVKRYVQAGLSGIMIEDQVSPKRCGHTKGKQVVGRNEAFRRVQAAVDARNEGQDIVILARTDARAIHGVDEAIERCRIFRQIGADMTFMEAPQSLDEMERYCREVDGPKLANMLEGGLTPIIPPEGLKGLGYRGVAAYPLTLLSASVKVMKQSLQLIKMGKPTDSLILPFKELQKDIGFDDYYTDLARYEGE